MWDIYETKNVTKSLKKIPKDIKHKYRAWVEIIRNGGSENLAYYPSFKDKQLNGKLRECRSSRLNIQYRVVYKEDKSIKEIIVMKVTPHNYKEILR